MEWFTIIAIKKTNLASSQSLEKNDHENAHIQVKKGENILSVAREVFPIQEYDLISIIIKPQCPGCESKEPNQFSHMGVGGCLYIASQ